MQGDGDDTAPSRLRLCFEEKRMCVPLLVSTLLLVVQKSLCDTKIRSSGCRAGTKRSPQVMCTTDSLQKWGISMGPHLSSESSKNNSILRQRVIDAVFI